MAAVEMTVTCNSSKYKLLSNPFLITGVYSISLIVQNYRPMEVLKIYKWPFKTGC